MAKQHFVPAAYIGNFSSQEVGKSRRRMVWVKRRGVTNPHKKKAESVAYRVNLYNEDVDKQWNSVENNLIKAINDLINSNKTRLSADMWVILVRFIAQMFVRGYEFDLRFRDRIERMFNKGNLKEYTNVDMSRLFELQRLHAPIMYADWTVIHSKTKKPIITNDLGFGLVKDIIGNKFGYMFPLSKSSVLVLVMGDRTIARIAPLEFHDNEWGVINITHREIGEDGINGLNRALGEFCLDEVYGSTEESVNHNLLEKRPVKFASGPNFLIPNKDYLRDCEMDLCKLISMITKVS